MAGTNSSPSGTKRSLKDALDSALDLDALEAIVREALTAQKEFHQYVEVTCKHCKKMQRPSVRIQVPDWNARKGFLQLAIEHSKGRAHQAPAPKEGPRISGNMEELSDEQLLALLNQDSTEEVSDGEGNGNEVS